MNPATRSFLRAAAEGDANLVRALLAQGTDVNSKNAAGQTALMIASAFGHLAVVKILLAAGAERELQDDLGLTALDWSINYTSIGELIAAPRVQTPPPEPTHTALIESPSEPVSLKNEEPERPQRAETPELSRRGLGGLAGAILRDKAVKVTDDAAPAEVVRTTPPPNQFEPEAPRSISTPNIPPDPVVLSKDEGARIPPSFDGEPAPIVKPEADYSAANNVPPISSTFKPPRKVLTPLPEDDIPDLPATFEKGVEVATPPSDDETWSGRETDDTASPGTRPIAAPRILGVGESEKKPPVPSKVKVDVPSFKPIHHSTPRPILWLLIILFVGIGAFGGYRLSNYLFERQNNSAPQETSAPQNQPLAAPIKLGPVIGGNLSGMELLVPDATYPPSAKVPYGSVTVRVQVDQRGKVTSARATDGDKTLRAAAEEAARRAAFSAEKLQDKGRFVVGTITYNFLAPQAEPANSPPEPAPSATSTTTPTVSTEIASTPKVGGPLSGAELNIPEPEYPSAARRDGIKGTVTLVIRVNNAGKVISWRTQEGNQRLRTAAIRAARAATFSPEKLPTKGDVVGTITYTFQP